MWPTLLTSIHPNDAGNSAIAAQMLLDGVLP